MRGPQLGKDLVRLIGRPVRFKAELSIRTGLAVSEAQGLRDVRVWELWVQGSQGLQDFSILWRETV